MNIKPWFCFLILCIGIGSGINGQCVSHQVLTPAGAVVVEGNYHLSETIGEAAVVLFAGTDYDLTQGFQQPHMRILFPEMPDGLSVNVYPNPVTDELKIQICPGEKPGFILELFSLDGRKLIREAIDADGLRMVYQRLDVSHLQRATYIVRIYSVDRNVDRRFLIEKM